MKILLYEVQRVCLKGTSIIIYHANNVNEAKNKGIVKIIVHNAHPAHYPVLHIHTRKRKTNVNSPITALYEHLAISRNSTLNLSRNPRSKELPSRLRKRRLYTHNSISILISSTLMMLQSTNNTLSIPSIDRRLNSNPPMPATSAWVKKSL